MTTADRRTFLRTLSAVTLACFGGCAGRAHRPESARPVESVPVRTTEPVRTEGDPVRGTRTESTERDPIAVLRSTVSTRSDCFAEEIPVQTHNAGLLITTRTVVKSLERADVAFPSPSYERLKRVAPRSLFLASRGETHTTTEETPVFIEAVLRNGDSERIVPSMDEDC